MRLPLRPVIDNARRLVLRHRVRPIKVSLGAHRSNKKRKGRDGRSRCAPTQTELQKARKKPHLGCALSLVASPRRARCPHALLSYVRAKAITANTGRRLGRVIIGESDKPISPGAIAGRIARHS